MRRLVETTDADGLEKFLGEHIQLWCINYIYAGLLVGVNENDCVLSHPYVVYETGKLTEEKFKFAESFGVQELFVRISSIEAYALAPQLKG